MAQLPTQSQFGDYGDWPGRDVLDSGGERLGGVREIYLDRETGRPEWVLVDVEGDEARFVPLADAEIADATIRVAHSAATIRSAPGIGTEPRIDQSEERRLYDHYGIGYSTEESSSGLPAEEPDDRAGGRREPEPSSWSDAAKDRRRGREPAPPPGEPPSPEEIEQAEIPEPPAATEPEPEEPSEEPEPVPPPEAELVSRSRDRSAAREPSPRPRRHEPEPVPTPSLPPAPPTPPEPPRAPEPPTPPRARPGRRRRSPSPAARWT